MDKRSNSKLIKTIDRIKQNNLSIIALILVILIVFTAIISEHFLSLYNIQSVLRDLAFVGMISVAMSLLLFIGELDLSVGKIASLCGVLGGLLMVHYGVNPSVSFAIALLVGTLLGAINGIIITALKLNAMVVTIGTSGVYAGLTLVITKGRAVPDIPEQIHFLGKKSVGFIPIPFLISLVVLLLLVILTKKTVTGRYIFAIGNSKEAARLLGIKTGKIRILLYSITGFVAALAGMLYVCRLGSAQTNIGENWAMNGIASCVIGGILLSGGVGNPLGAMLGAAIISVIQNMIVISGVNMYVQSAISGIVVVLAISFSSISNIIKERRKQKAEIEMQIKRHHQSVES